MSLRRCPRLFLQSSTGERNPMAGANGKPGSTAPLSEAELQDLVAATDTGARKPVGYAAWVISGVALCWSLFQLYIASPLPFTLSSLTGLPLVLNDTQTRSIHLAFGLFLAFMAYPALASSPRDRVPVQDWIFAILAACTALYISVFYAELARRPGLPITQDLVVAGLGIIFLLEAT